MTTLFSITFVVILAALVTVVLLRPRGPALRDEPLGNPHRRGSEPVVRSESRHHDTPAAADLGQHSGRHDSR
jgi:hypothetical protein